MFGVTTFSLWCRYMRLNHAGQRQFYNTLIRDNLIQSAKFQTCRSPVLLLSVKGKQRSITLLPQSLNIITRPTAISETQLMHRLYVQKCVIELHDQGEIYLSERALALMELKTRPDALIYHKGQPSAIEAELTAKHYPRIFFIFRMHLSQMKRGIYRQVYYCFDKSHVYNYYQRLFHLDSWPLVIYDKRHARYRIKQKEKKPLRFDPGASRKQFIFRNMADANI